MSFSRRRSAFPRERSFAGSIDVWLDTLHNDLRHAGRALLHSRAFTLWVVGSLAIGMAVTIAALAVLNATLILPFPEVADQHRLVRVSVSRNCGRPNCWVRMSSPADYLALREGLHGVQGLAAYALGDAVVALPEARPTPGALVSANYFDVLGVRLALGRTFNTTDADTHAPVAVIAHHVWTREFGGEPAAIGRSLRVGDEFVEIVGIAPALFAGIDRARPEARRSMGGDPGPDIWLPLWLGDRVLPLRTGGERRQERSLSFVGRLKDGVEVPQLQAEASALARRLAPPSPGGRAGVERVWKVHPRNWHFGVIVVMPIPILVLAIASVNAANLMLARGSERQREIAIRLAIGAGRGRIVRQLFLESAVLAGLATAVALPIAWWGLELADSPWSLPIPLDATVLALTVLTAAATTLAFGVAPAVRISAQQPSSALGSAGARGDASPRQSRMRRFLVVAQVALSLGLLATGWQLVSTVRAQAVSAGTPSDRLLIARFNLQLPDFEPNDIDAFYRDLLAGTLRLPGVEAAGLARHTSVWTFGHGAAPGSVVVWRPADEAEAGQAVIGGYAAGDLFEAVGLRIVAGRGFTDADRQTRPQVAVVNETAAKSIMGPAVGSILRVAARGQDVRSAIEVRVVGVVEPAIEPRLEPDGPPAPKVYLPSPLQPEPALALYVRTHGAATTLALPLRELVSRVAPRAPILEIGSLEDFNERSYATQLWLARSAAVLGVIGLLLATAGLYGVSSYVVAMRTREIAIRMAIGARPQTILTMVLGQSMRVAVTGLLVGGAGALVVSRVIQSEYHGIQGFDSVAFGGASALFLGAMLLASAIPAVRASRLDPIGNLKDG